jgi:hypothetical protein
MDVNPFRLQNMNKNYFQWLYKAFSLPGGRKVPLIYGIWFLLAAVAVILEMARGLGSIDNFLIYRGVFWHVFEQKNLFQLYPLEYESFNNYGPAFSLIIAPFALLPVYIGCFLWAMSGAIVLFFAIQKLPLLSQQKIIVLWISCIEMMTATHNVQFNTLLTAFIILSFVFTLEGKDWLATLFIAAGTLSKVYGIVGLLFFFFSKNKKQFAFTYIGWMLLIVCLPMLYSSYHYILQTYREWFQQIAKRNEQNVFNSTYAGMQDISAMGMIRRIFGWYSFPEMKLVAVAGIVLLLPFVKTNRWQLSEFQLSYLSLLLITVVVFSSASESPSFVLAVTGAAIWFAKKPILWKSGYRILLIGLFLFTILSPTDLIPAYIRTNFIQAYSLKALPCCVIWVVILWEAYRIHDKSDIRTIT